MADQFTGIVERCELKTRAPFRVNRYSPAEQTEIYLDVCLRLADGSADIDKFCESQKRSANIGLELDKYPELMHECGRMNWDCMRMHFIPHNYG